MLAVKKVVTAFITAVLCSLSFLGALAQNNAAANPVAVKSVSAASTIPVGTRITVNNWHQYKEFMPDGMIALFRGDYYSKMPAMR